MPVSLSAKVLVVGVAPNGGRIVQVIIRSPDGTAVTGEVELDDLLQGQEVTAFVDEPKGRDLPTRKAIKKLSMNQERRVAESLGGQRQRGSGARPGHKGDGRVRDRFRIENKLTFNKELKVPYSDLQKIRAECTGLEVPLYEVDFMEKGTERVLDKWGLMPWVNLKELLDADPSTGDDR